MGNVQPPYAALVDACVPEALAQSLLKTSADFRNPPIRPAEMLWSISSPNQFDNPELADVLAKKWRVKSADRRMKRKDINGT